jgi:hypothetical protein
VHSLFPESILNPAKTQIVQIECWHLLVKNIFLPVAKMGWHLVAEMVVE